ncbi:MAG: SIS domain-containing protein [Bacteroidota bacterium]
MQREIKHIISESISIKELILEDDHLLMQIEEVVNILITAFRQGKKVLFCGNGGSAADSLHLATELSGRFYLERAPLFAEALPADNVFLTAIGNDYSYEETFARLLEAKGREGDVLIALSTSGTSPNIIKALERARSLHMKTIGFSGASGGKMPDLCDLLLKIPSTDTPRIQEAHMLVGHIVCQFVEAALA